MCPIGCYTHLGLCIRKKKPLHLENRIINLIDNIIGRISSEFGFEGLETAVFSEHELQVFCSFQGETDISYNI